MLLQTVDFFTPVVDDPYHFGQIAAANSLSDIYAMGGKPLFALNIVGFPINELPKSILTEILQGGIDKAEEANIPIVGGHSVDDKEPKYGLVVTGEVNEKNLWKNSGAKVGDALVLTKPLGTGIIATAIKKGIASQKCIDEATKSMASLNKDAAEILSNLKVNAVTDVTGFGLLGHLNEICASSNVSSIVNFSDIALLPDAQSIARSGIIPGGTKRNLNYLKNFISFDSQIDQTVQYLLSDAQTSGGLLVSLPLDQAQILLNNMDNKPKIIGEIIEQKSNKIIIK